MTNQTARWLTIREASLQLGVSELTIRRRIKDGKMGHRLEGGKYFVQVEAEGGSPNGNPVTQPPEPALTTHESAADTPVPVGPNIDLDALLAEHGRLAELAGRSQTLQDQLRELQERHAELQQGAMALANRNGWLESKLEDREEAIKLLTDNQRPRSWWRRIFGQAGA